MNADSTKKTEAQKEPQREPHRGGRTWVAPLAAGAAIVAAALAVYSNTLAAAFQFDDILNIVENKFIHQIKYLWPPVGTRYLAYLSFALNYQVGGTETFGYHLVNTLIHAGSGVLLWRLIVLTSRTPLSNDDEFFQKAAGQVALVAALVFVAHPIQTQAVTYITQRFASMATLFYLLAVVFYIKARLGGRARGTFVRPVPYFASLIFTIAAMKTKEISFTLPFVVALCEYTFFAWTNHKERAIHFIPYALALTLIPLSLFTPELGLGKGAAGAAEMIRELQVEELTTLPWHKYFLTEIGVVVTYLRLLIVPVGQNVIHPFHVPESIFEARVFISFIFLTTLLSGAVYTLLLAKKKKDPLAAVASFGVLWFFITISVESSVIPIQDVIFEHRLYLPSAGAFTTFAALLYMGVRRYSRRTGKPVATKLFTAVVLLATALPLAIAAFERNKAWSDAVTLWEDVVEKNSNSPLAYAMLGVSWAKAGNRGKALENQLMAAKLAPRNSYARYNLGFTYGVLGRYDEAIRELKATIELDRNHTDAHYNLALAYEKKGRMGKAAEHLEKATDLDPELHKAFNKLGLAYAALGKTDDSIRAFEEAARLVPTSGEFRNNLGFAYYLAGRYDDAERELREAIAIGDNMEKAGHTLAVMEKQKKGEDGASVAPSSP